jgi:hypothetical protein
MVSERPELEQRSWRAVAVPQGDSQDKSRHFVGLDTGLSFVKTDGSRVHLPIHTVLTAMSALRGRPSSHRLNISALPFVPNAKLADAPRASTWSPSAPSGRPASAAPTAPRSRASTATSGSAR